MNGYLLDVNVFIALAWPSHVFHERVLRWFGKNAERGWATCPLTETAFVRILSNPSFSPRSLTPDKAADLLQRNVAHSAHQFWPADLTLDEALNISHVRPIGHQQISDVYLLGLAVRNKGLLVTCDEAIPKWEAPGRGDRFFVELIG